MTQTVCLADIATIVRGVTYDRDSVQVEALAGYIPILRAGNIQDQLLLSEDLVWVPPALVSEQQRLKPNDLLMCTSSGSASVVGKTALFESTDWNGSFGAFCAAIRPTSGKCHPAFLKHLLRSTPFLSWARASLGANIKNIRKSELEQFRFTLPHLNVQQHIANVLDSIHSLRRKRQTVIRTFDDLERAVFIKTFGDPDINPLGFPLGTIRDMVASANYGTSEKANDEAGEFPILRMNNITYAGSLDLTSVKYIDLDKRVQEKYLARKGDLLFNRTNSTELVGKTAIYELDEPMAIAGYLVRVRMNERGNPYYVSGYLNSLHGKRALVNRAKSIVGMANINAQEMQNLPILIPPIDLQNQFQKVIESIRKNQKKNLASEKKLIELHSNLADHFFDQ